MNLSFFIVRHVTNIETAYYWQLCYKKIREFYPENQIYIIDDNSPFKVNYSIDLYKCSIIESEFPKRGELLCYYYFHKLKNTGESAIMLHDSVFFHKHIDFSNFTNYKFLWCFEHHWDPDILTVKLLKKCKNNEKLIDFYYKKDKWIGCAGVMSFITWDFLDKIDSEFNFLNTMIENINCRKDRECLERIFSCMCTLLDKNKSSMFGDKHTYTRFVNSLDFKNYMKFYNELKHYPIMKIYTGR